MSLHQTIIFASCILEVFAFCVNVSTCVLSVVYDSHINFFVLYPFQIVLEVGSTHFHVKVTQELLE